MRRLALPLLFALASLAFAPAPFPRRDRETPARKRERVLSEYARRLDRLGVKWEVMDNGGPAVRYDVRHPKDDSTFGGSIQFFGSDLPQVLLELIERVEAFLAGH